jgi:hypothetical protein
VDGVRERFVGSETSVAFLSCMIHHLSSFVRRLNKSRGLLAIASRVFKSPAIKFVRTM